MRQLKITKQITDRSDKSLDKYLYDISKEGLISPEEEVELAKKIQNGDVQAAHKLVKANLRFVVSVAKQYQHYGLSLTDLISEGNIGLITAAMRFDATKGFKFISYAVWWVRQSILYAIAEYSRLIRLPQNQILTLNRLNKKANEMEQLRERDVSVRELAELFEMKEEKVRKLLAASRKHGSFDAPVSHDDDSKLGDNISSKDVPDTDHKLMKESLQFEINSVLNILTERERIIIKKFFGIGMRKYTYEEISEELNVSGERIRQLKDKALKRLRNSQKKNNLIKYL